MIQRLAHVCFVVENLTRSTEFYQDALGLRHGFDFINDQGQRFGVYLCAGGQTFVELFTGEHDAPTNRQSYTHCCFEVDDIQATVAELQAKGVEVGPVKMGSDHSWQAWLADPDGNRIELHQYTAESLQLQCRRD